MLPSDLTGTMAIRAGSSCSGPGPVFTNVLLADEINRTPPKTQAALLEAMQEAQVRVDGEPHRLPTPFIVIATQNPIEYEGTYPLPEAQLDRFLLQVDVGYPSARRSAACSSSSATASRSVSIASAAGLAGAASAERGGRAASV